MSASLLSTGIAAHGGSISGTVAPLADKGSVIVPSGYDFAAKRSRLTERYLPDSCAEFLKNTCGAAQPLCGPCAFA